jgi:hypothetical protein
MIYAAVGLAATAVHLLAALLLHSLAGFGPLSANAAAFALAWSVSYAGNHLLTFEAGARHRQAMPRFIVVSGIGFALNQSIGVVAGRGHELAVLAGAGAGCHYRATDRLCAVAPVGIQAGRNAPCMSVSNPCEAASGRAGAGKLDGGVATLAWLAGWLVIGLSVAMQLAVPVNHDAAWVLIGAQRLLEGASFGSGVVDVNPPLAWWISAIPVALAGATGLPTGLVFKLFVMVAALVSVLASARLMQTAGLTQSHSRWIALARCCRSADRAGL